MAGNGEGVTRSSGHQGRICLERGTVLVRRVVIALTHDPGCQFRAFHQCISDCSKFDKKSLIAVQTLPLLVSKIPLWVAPSMGRNVTGLRGPAACARRSDMANGTSSSLVPCPMKIGQLTRQILLTLSKRSLMKRRTTDLGTHGSMAWACSGMFVNAPSTIKPAACLRATRSMATAALKSPASDNDPGRLGVKGLGEVVVGCVRSLVASRLARPAATHPVSRIIRDQDGASQLAELRKLVAAGLQAHAVAVKVYQVRSTWCRSGGFYSGWLARTEQEVNAIATAGRAGKNGRALVGPHQDSFCRLPPASGEDQGGLEL